MSDLRTDIRAAFQKRLDRAPMAADFPERVARRVARPRSHRRLMVVLVAAAAIALLGVGGGVLLAAHRPHPVPPARPVPTARPTPTPAPSATPTPVPTATPTPRAAAPTYSSVVLTGGAAGNMVVAPDGSVWFGAGDRIGRMAPGGQITYYTVPDVVWITLGPDGAIWFTGPQGSIGRMTLQGSVTSFPLPTPQESATDIVTGPDGALWFTEMSGNKIGRITTSGAVTEFPLPDRGGVQCGEVCPAGITVSGGDVWFAESQSSAAGGDRIGRMTPGGDLTEFPLPTTNADPYYVAATADGSIWFSEQHGIGRITPSGSIQEYSIPGQSAAVTVDGLTVGSDGAVWFTANTHDNPDLPLKSTGSILGRIDASGQITTYPLPAAAIGAGVLSEGAGGTLVFPSYDGTSNRVWTVTP
ncbi:MAG TPA: hypothetical protein VIA06_13965 [Candidatus Dormibacteraeota bacterium]|jgi:virginiamycin B lyase|nr:hypothetical protein [Candidatus Dormibacteraeota bacterium]